jgi:hypothetical protein
MEKFNRWSDPATGINPFVPVNRNHRLSFIAKVFSFFGGILLLLIRIPILICVGFAHFILSACFERIPVNAIRRLLLRFVDVVFIGTILFLLGFWNTPLSYADRNRLRLRRSKSNNRPTSVGSNIKPGDIILSNYTSYIEVLVLAYWFSPIFANVVTKDGKFEEAGVVPESVWQTVARSLSSGGLPKSANTRTLKQLSKENCGSPIVCFPEGVKTNGSGILKFPPIFDEYDFSQHEVHLMGFKYDPNSATSPTFPVGTWWKHLCGICCTWQNVVSAILLPADELVAPPEARESSEKVSDRDFRTALAERATTGAYGGGVLPTRKLPAIGIFGERARTLLASMLRVKVLGRCALDYEDFLTYFDKRAKKKTS